MLGEILIVVPLVANIYAGFMYIFYLDSLMGVIIGNQCDEIKQLGAFSSLTLAQLPLHSA